MVLTGIGMDLYLFLSPTALLSGIMASDGPDRDSSLQIAPDTDTDTDTDSSYSSFDWYVVI